MDSCDLGNQSILHAVKIVARNPPPGGDSNHPPMPTQMAESSTAAEGASAPLCESLIDLQLSQEERVTLPQAERPAKKAHFYVWCNSPCSSMQVIPYEN